MGYFDPLGMSKACGLGWGRVGKVCEISRLGSDFDGFCTAEMANFLFNMSIQVWESSNVADVSSAQVFQLGRLVLLTA